MTPTDEQLREIRERLEKATPGPWDMFCGSKVRAIKGDLAVPIFESLAPIGWHKRKNLTHKVLCKAYSDEWANANFIAHAPTDISTLLGAIDERDAEIERLKNANDMFAAEVFKDDGICHD